MTGDAAYRIFADVVLVTHVAFVVFVVLGLALVICGGILHWQWIRNPWFRLLHLVAIGVVILQAWLGVMCPLTTLEMALRAQARETAYQGDFIAYWLQRLLYYDGPPWAFTLCYSLFGILVVCSWLWFRPLPFRRGDLHASRTS